MGDFVGLENCLDLCRIQRDVGRDSAMNDGPRHASRKGYG